MDNNIQHGWATICGVGILVTFLENNYQLLGLAVGVIGLVMNVYFGLRNIKLKKEELELKKTGLYIDKQ